MALSPLILGWLVAVGIRLATGSATVATITAAGLVAPLAAQMDRAGAAAAHPGDRLRIGVLLARERRRVLAGEGVFRTIARRDAEDLVGDGNDHQRRRAGRRAVVARVRVEQVEKSVS